MKLCAHCKRKISAAGQAFTPYRCGHCFKAHMHANTAVPRICPECAENKGRCQKCLNKIGDPICSRGNHKDMCRCVYPKNGGVA